MQSESTNIQSFAPVGLWSGEMFRIVRRCAKYQSYIARLRHVEEDELYQVGIVAVADAFVERRAEILDYSTVASAARWSMEHFWRPKKVLAENGYVVRIREPLDHAAEIDGSSALATTEAVYDVLEAARGLSPLGRRIVWGLHRERRSIREIARSEKLTTTAACAQRSKAYRLLRAALNQGYGWADRRKREAKMHRRAWHRNPKTDWSGWGPIPNQRRDDDEA
jgi:hypothetical protein